MDVKSSLKELLRFESLSIIRETAKKTDDQKLLVLEFLVRAFALVGDIEASSLLYSSLCSFRIPEVMLIVSFFVVVVVILFSL